MAVQDFLAPLRLYASFSGRAARRGFWPFAIASIFALGAVAAVALPLTPLLGLALALPLWSATVRRLHDINLSGLLLLPILACPVLMLIVLVMATSLWTLLVVALVDDTIGTGDISAGAVAIETALAWGLGIYLLLTFIVLCWKGNEGTNRFGGARI